VTRSLISQPAVRPPSQPPVIVDDKQLADEPPRIIMDSGAQTRMIPIESVPVAAPAAPTQMLPPAAPPPAQMLALAASMLPAPELASIHGGNTFTGSSAAIAVGDRSSRWAFGVLGAAALAGAIAAVVLGTKHDEDMIAAPTPVETPTKQVDPPTPPPPAPQVAVAPETKTETKTETPAPPPPVATTKPDTKTDTKPDTKTDTKPDKTETAAGSGSSLESKLAARRVASSKAATKKTGEAVLQVDEWNGEYANIAIGGQSHDTPGAKFYLPSGPYTLVVHNDAEKFTCHVTLDPGKTLHIHVSLENRSCSD